MFHLYYGRSMIPRATAATLDELIGLARSEERLWQIRRVGCCITDEKGFVKWAPGDRLYSKVCQRELPVYRRDIWGRWWEWDTGRHVPIFPDQPEAIEWIARAREQQITP